MSSKQTKITANLDGMEKWKKKVAKDLITRVGILGSDAQRTGEGPLNNAEIGLIQMFGSVTNNIPPRDFLAMPIEANKREIMRAMQSGTPRDAFLRGDFKKVFQLLGLKAEEVVQRAFETGGFGMWPPLKVATVRRKGSDKPLIDTSQLRRSITSDVVSKGGNQGVAVINVTE